MSKIILDTNFLLIPFQFGVDIFTEIERIIPEKTDMYIIDKTINELHKIIEEQKGKNKAAAGLALEILKKKLKKKTLKTLKTENNLNVDELIANLAKTGEFIVATQDMALKRILKAHNTKILVLRQKKYLQLI